MADVTGGTPPTGASEFDVPGDLKAVYDHFGDSGMFSVANAAALPSTGNWAGRILMTVDAGAVYRWNGSWALVSSDTGWVALTPASGWTAGSGANTPQVRRVGNVVFYRGSLFGGTANTTAATVTAPFRPERELRIPITGSGPANGILRIYTSGILQPSMNLDAFSTASWLAG